MLTLVSEPEDLLRIRVGVVARPPGALHLAGPGGAFTPAWYPWLCLGFDLPIAFAVMAQGRRLR